jgi:tetratricopeptide (TPR) repeat protein
VQRPGSAKAADYWHAAEKLFDSGEFPKAVACLARFRPAPNDQAGEAAYLHLRGASRLMLGEVSLARNDLERALQLDGTLSGYYLDLVLACLKAGNAARAEEISALARQRLPGDIKLQIQIASLTNPVHAVSAKWHLHGDGLIGCPCKVPCPCRSNAPPTADHCEALGVMQIDSGQWGNTALKDLRFAIPGCMGHPYRLLPVLYVDSSASPAELEALKQILYDFNEQHSLSFVEIKRVPISFQRLGVVLDAGSPGLFRLKVELSPGSAPVAALDYFSNTIRYGKNLLYWFKDPALSPAAAWDYSGKQANYRIISISSDDYRQKRMLIQWADESGGFNAPQLRLIRELHLPVAGTH